MVLDARRYSLDVLALDVSPVLARARSVGPCLEFGRPTRLLPSSDGRLFPQAKSLPVITWASDLEAAQ